MTIHAADPGADADVSRLDTIPESWPQPLTVGLTPGEVAQMLVWRRELHAEPELSTQENDTQAWLRATLTDMGMDRVATCGGTGLVVRLGRGEIPRVLLLRADMDALPLDEQTGLAFASKRPGAMHACGHDAHMAVLLAVGRRLRVHEDDLRGTVILCFQPAEERSIGALAMIGEGMLDGRLPLLEGLKVQHALGLHVWSQLATGVISAAAGPVMAAVDEFTITVRGRGGHGAVPQSTADAVVAAAAVVQALQTIASRRTDPLDPVVVTVGSIHGGDAFNVIAEEVILRGTVRSYSKNLGQRLPGLVADIAQAAAAVHGAKAETRYVRHAIALHNDPVMAHLVATAAAAAQGVTRVDRHLRLMAGEDMAYVLDAVPGCYFFVGCGGPDAEPHHSPRFTVDEAALPIAAAVMLRAVVSYFGDDDLEPHRPGAML